MGSRSSGAACLLSSHTSHISSIRINFELDKHFENTLHLASDCVLVRVPVENDLARWPTIFDRVRCEIRLRFDLAGVDEEQETGTGADVHAQEA